MKKSLVLEHPLDVQFRRRTGVPADRLPKGGGVSNIHRIRDPRTRQMAAIARAITMMAASVKMDGNAHASIQAANSEFLKYAASMPRPSILGTIASGSSGGAASPVVWARVLPVTPRWVEKIELYCSLPYSLVIPAGATVTISPYFPWCMIQNKFTIAGSPPWDQISMVPFWLDDITSRQGWDPSVIGPGNTAMPSTATGLANNQGGLGLPPKQVDLGTWGFSTGNALVVPGGTIHNTGTAAETVTGTATFCAEIQLQRRNQFTFGMVPNGDPQDRPDLEVVLSPMVGTQPENSPFQDIAAAGITCTLASAGTVIAVWRSKGLDVLPEGVNPAQPQVGLGWSINSFTSTVQNAGQINETQHRAAMLYQKIFQLLVSGQVAVDPNYIGLWLTGEQQNARWEYDASQNSMQSYWNDLLDRYQRLMPLGSCIFDFVGGNIPELPQTSPYMGMMSPDENYAKSFGVAFTPAMETAQRFPSGTTMTSAYVRTYSMGYVEVPY